MPVIVPNPQPQSTDTAPNQQPDHNPQQSDRAARANRTSLAGPEPDATGAPDRAAKMRAVQQSARCANQPRSGGKFGKTKKQKKADAVVTDQAAAAPANALPELSNSEMAGFLHHLNAAYQSAVQNALSQASSEMLHTIQSSHLSLPSEREDAMKLWEETKASAAAAIEMINIPTVAQTNLIAVANLSPEPRKRKRKIIIPVGVSSHKSQRRSTHGIDNAQRDDERDEEEHSQLREDALIALHLQATVKAELHYSQRRLVGIAAYYKARALGMSKEAAAEDAARSIDVGARTLRRWKSEYLSEGDGFFTNGRWGAHRKTPYLLADKTLQKDARS